MHVRGLQDSVLPIMEAGLVDLVDDGHELARGLHLTLLPGHTMGQMGLRIDRPDGRAIFCGDTVHSPAQIYQPSVSTSSCLDPHRAAETRQILFKEAAVTRQLVVPAHFRGWRRAYVRETGTGLRRFSRMMRDKVVAASNRCQLIRTSDVSAHTHLGRGFPSPTRPASSAERL
jgi:glyoxylase-like metal-dependent hydrolase (beta-lactamase superfamily II)